MKKLTINELVIFERLLIENKNSEKLRMRTECGYYETIDLLNKLRKILERDN